MEFVESADELEATCAIGGEAIRNGVFSSTESVS
jgi:hypothetical protein